MRRRDDGAGGGCGRGRRGKEGGREERVLVLATAETLAHLALPAPSTAASAARPPCLSQALLPPVLELAHHLLLLPPHRLLGKKEGAGLQAHPEEDPRGQKQCLKTVPGVVGEDLVAGTGGGEEGGHLNGGQGGRER